MRQHGTRARYAHGPDEHDDPSRPCRCEPCTLGNRKYAAWLDAAHRRGYEPFLEGPAVDEVREHVQRLTEAVGLRQVCAQAGVSRSALQRLMQGRERIRPETADRLLALQQPRPADNALIEAGPTWEKIDALLRAGYTKTWIAQQTTGGKAIQFGRELVTVRNAARIDVVYRRFIGIPPHRKVAYCCWTTGGERCSWTPTSEWFCIGCGYALHACPP